MQAFRGHLMPLGVALLVAAAAGCSTGKTSVPNQTAPLQAQTSDRQVQDVTQAPSLDELAAHLPARISAADANRLLVRIDPSRIQAPATGSYQVMATGGRGGGRGGAMSNGGRSMSGGNRGMSGGNRGTGEERGEARGEERNEGFERNFNNFSNFGFFNGFYPFSSFYPYSSFLYYPYLGNYYPYYLYGSEYYPYSYMDYAFNRFYYPYLRGCGAGYNPYYWTSPNALGNWGNFTGQPGQAGYGQPNSGQQPTPTPSST